MSPLLPLLPLLCLCFRVELSSAQLQALGFAWPFPFYLCGQSDLYECSHFLVIVAPPMALVFGGWLSTAKCSSATNLV